MQLNLGFADLPEPEDGLWPQLEEVLREAAIDKIARLIAKALAEHPARESSDD